MSEQTTKDTPAADRRGIDLGIWRSLWRFTRPYRGELLQLTLCAVVVAAADLAYPQVTRLVVDEVARRDGTAKLAPHALAYVAIALVQCVAVWRFVSLGGLLRSHLGHDLREAGFKNLQRLSFSYFDHRPVGWLMARMTSDCDRLAMILAWGVLDLVWATSMMVGVAALMFWMQPLLAVLVLTVAPALLAVSLYFQRRILGTSRGVRRSNARLTAAFNENLAANRTSRSFSREAEDAAEFGGLAGEMEDVSVRNALYGALYLPMVLTLGSLASGLALAYGGLEVVAGGIGLGTLIAFIVYARNLFEPVQDLARRFVDLQMAQASAERILGLIEEVPDIRDAPGVAGRGREHDRVREIELRDVSFAYKDRDGAPGEPVVEGLDLRVEAGSTVALVGPTGGGKSTLVSLLCRFYEPTRGRVLFDGVDYRERPLAWLEARLGIVQQTPHLFSGTVAENVRYGRLDATDEEVREATRLAGADGFVRELEHGYDTEVGEGGGRLSTGQKQLLSIARAILRDPEILVLDEATSSVDTETERCLQAALERVLARRTAFVIAHRLSTIRSADRILVVEGGRIVEDGSHEELLALHGRYRALYTQQSLRESATHAEDWDGAAGAV